MYSRDCVVEDHMWKGCESSVQNRFVWESELAMECRTGY